MNISNSNAAYNVASITLQQANFLMVRFYSLQVLYIITPNTEIPQKCSLLSVQTTGIFPFKYFHLITW